jgi:hypothetical protein
MASHWHSMNRETPRPGREPGDVTNNFIFPELAIDLLRTFVAVVGSGSFTKASRAVFRSQAAVSMQVKLLEESIGQPLFVRGYSKS